MPVYFLEIASCPLIYTYWSAICNVPHWEWTECHSLNGQPQQHSDVRRNLDLSLDVVPQDFDIAITDGDFYYPALTSDASGNFIFTFGHTSATDGVLSKHVRCRSASSRTCDNPP